MKHFILIGFMSIFTSCLSQKNVKNDTKISFSAKKDIFYSNQNGGALYPSFSMIKNQEELDKVMLGEGTFIIDNENTDNQKITFPKNRKVIKYNLGEFRSGSHTPEKLDAYRVNGETLELFIKKGKFEKEHKTDLEFSIQVVTRPYIIFSVPKKIEFKKISIIYE
jgi:hypothetical protein